MPIRLPQEPVYYYECSAGDFRLVYYIPRNELERLCAEEGLSPATLEDFPDGVDLDCTEPDFRDFDEHCGWRPAHSPNALRRAFSSVRSGTRRWKTFRGTGLITADELEQQLEPVGNALALHDVEEVRPEPREGAEKAPRRLRRRRLQRRVRQDDVLERLQLADVDPTVDLKQQSFRRPKYTDGDAAGEVFARLHQGRRRPR